MISNSKAVLIVLTLILAPTTLGLEWSAGEDWQNSNTDNIETPEDYFLLSSQEEEELIEDFSDFSDWTNGERTSTDFSLSSSESSVGSYSAHRSFSHYVDYAVSSYQASFDPGDTFKADVYIKDEGNGPAAAFYTGAERVTDDSGSPSRGEGSTQARPGLYDKDYYRVGGSETVEDTPLDYEGDRWVTNKLYWDGQKNELEAELLDSSGNLIKSTTVEMWDVEEQEYEGLAIRTFRGGSYFDNFRRISEEFADSGNLITEPQSFDDNKDISSLELMIDAEISDGSARVIVEGDGEHSDTIDLSTGSNIYSVEGLSTDTDEFQLNFDLFSEDSSPEIHSASLDGESANEPPEIIDTWLEKDNTELNADDEKVPLEPDLVVDVEDEYYVGGDDLSVTFYQGDVGAGELGTVEAGNTENAVLEGYEHDLGEDTGTSYEWSVEVEDPEGETDTAGPWTFTTEHEPEIMDSSAVPQGGEIVSTTPELSVNVSHEDGKEMDVYFFLEGDFVDESQISANGEASADVEDTLDADESYNWYVSVEDEEGYEINNEASTWSFETDGGEVDVAVLDDSDNVNLNPYSQGVLNVEPGHSHADTIDYLRLLDGGGEVVETVEDVTVGEPISLLWPSEDLDPNREYEWSAEAEHSGEAAQTDTSSFSTIAVEVALSGNVPDAEGYNIYRREESETGDPTFDYGNMDYEGVGLVDELDNTLRDVSEGLETGKTYCYVATAYNVGGEGPASEEVCMESEVQLE